MKRSVTHSSMFKKTMRIGLEVLSGTSWEEVEANPYIWTPAGRRQQNCCDKNSDNTSHYGGKLETFTQRAFNRYLLCERKKTNGQFLWGYDSNKKVKVIWEKCCGNTKKGNIQTGVKASWERGHTWARRWSVQGRGEERHSFCGL